MIELVLPKSPLLDYPSDGFDWNNYPMSPVRACAINAMPASGTAHTSAHPSQRRNVTLYHLPRATEARKPLISVVTMINSAGAVQYFNESLTTLMQQSMQEFEWILLLASSDLLPIVNPTLERIMPTFGALHPPIYVLVEAPANLVDFWLALGKAANASLIFHLAVDSMLEPTALEKAYWHLSAHDAPQVRAVSGQTVYFSLDRRARPAVGFQLGELMLERHILPTEMLWRKETWMGLRNVEEVQHDTHTMSHTMHAAVHATQHLHSPLR